MILAGFLWGLISLFAFAGFASRRFYVAWQEVAKELSEGASKSDLLPILNAARSQFYSVMLATTTGGLFIICALLVGLVPRRIPGPPDAWLFTMFLFVQCVDAVLNDLCG